MEFEELKKSLKENLVKHLNLMEIDPATITDEEPLFGGRLELDSIDSLEIIVMIEREYGIKINNPTEARKILVNIQTMAEYIQANTH